MGPRKRKAVRFSMESEDAEPNKRGNRLEILDEKDLNALRAAELTYTFVSDVNLDTCTDGSTSVDPFMASVQELVKNPQTSRLPRLLLFHLTRLAMNPCLPREAAHAACLLDEALQVNMTSSNPQRAKGDEQTEDMVWSPAVHGRLKESDAVVELTQLLRDATDRLQEAQEAEEKESEPLDGNGLDPEPVMGAVKVPGPLTGSGVKSEPSDATLKEVKPTEGTAQDDGAEGTNVDRTEGKDEDRAAGVPEGMNGAQASGSTNLGESCNGKYGEGDEMHMARGGDGVVDDDGMVAHTDEAGAKEERNDEKGSKGRRGRPKKGRGAKGKGTKPSKTAEGMAVAASEAVIAKRPKSGKGGSEGEGGRKEIESAEGDEDAKEGHTGGTEEEREGEGKGDGKAEGENGAERREGMQEAREDGNDGLQRVEDDMMKSAIPTAVLLLIIDQLCVDFDARRSLLLEQYSKVTPSCNLSLVRSSLLGLLLKSRDWLNQRELWAAACDLLFTAAGLIAPETEEEEGVVDADEGDGGAECGEQHTKGGEGREGGEGQNPIGHASGGSGKDGEEKGAGDESGGERTAGEGANQGECTGMVDTGGKDEGVDKQQVTSRGSEEQGVAKVDEAAARATSGEDRGRGSRGDCKSRRAVKLADRNEGKEARETDAVAVSSCVYSARRDALRLINGVQRLISVAWSYFSLLESGGAFRRQRNCREDLEALLVEAFSNGRALEEQKIFLETMGDPQQKYRFVTLILTRYGPQRLRQYAAPLFNMHQDCHIPLSRMLPFLGSDSVTQLFKKAQSIPCNLHVLLLFHALQAHINGAAALDGRASSDIPAVQGRSSVTTRRGSGRQAHGGEDKQECEGKGGSVKAADLRELIVDACKATRRAAKSQLFKEYSDMLSSVCTVASFL